MRWLVASTMVVSILVAGCTSAGASASPLVTVTLPPVASVAPVPSAAAPTPSSVVTAPPSVGPSPSVAPSPLTKAQAESTLLAGIRKDAKVACAAQQGSLPQAAVAGIECHPRSDLMTSVGFYAFGTQADLLSTYFALLAAHGVAPRSGDCFIKAGAEDAYQPGDGTDGIIAAREGCFVASGKASDLSTNPGQPVGDGGYTFGGPFVLVLIHGASASVAKLHAWAWLGNKAEPGEPTAWNL